MKKKITLVCTLAILGLFISQAPSSAHTTTSNAVASVVGAVVGLGAGVAIGSSINSHHPVIIQNSGHKPHHPEHFRPKHRHNGIICNCRNFHHNPPPPRHGDFGRHHGVSFIW